MRLAALLFCLATPAFGGVTEAVQDAIFPGILTFRAATETLAGTARADCRAVTVVPAYQAAFDAWIGISHLQFGPLEAGGRNLSIAFWPDARGMVPATVAELIARRDPAVDSEERFAELSVAGRGLFALETLLYDAERSGYGKDSYECRLATALAADLARTARAVEEDWSVTAGQMTGAGAEGNAAYLNTAEAKQELYTALMAALEFDKDQRLGRPMGSFDRPRPTRAEAWRSGRSLRNLTLSLEALRGFAATLAAPEAAPRTDAAFDLALKTAAALNDPVFAGVDDPTGRLKIEILQQKVGDLQDAASAEIGGLLGVAEGFNSQDGD